MPNKRYSKQKAAGRFRFVIYIIEAKQASGYWEPVAAPKGRPFSKVAAKKRLRELILEYPYMQASHRRKMLRIRRYAMVREEE